MLLLLSLLLISRAWPEVCLPPGLCDQSNAIVFQEDGSVAKGKLTVFKLGDFEGINLLEKKQGTPLNDLFETPESKRLKPEQWAQVAVADPGACVPGFALACNGASAKQKSEKSLIGMIVGVFPGQGRLLLETPSGKYLAFAAKDLEFHPPPSAPIHNYEWILNGPVAAGCIERTDIAPSPDPDCAADLLPKLECTGSHESRVIKDIASCRRILPIKPGWLKMGDTMACMALGEGSENGVAKKVLAGWLPDEECDHRWYELNPESCDPELKGELPFHPLNHFGLGDLIPEIMNLKEGAVVPPEIFQKYDSKSIALTIVYKMHQDYEKNSEKVTRLNYDFLDGGEIQLVFSENLIQKINENGFLNVHQLFPDKAFQKTRDLRTKVEDKLLGYALERPGAADLQNEAEEVRPKSAVYGLQEGAPEKSPILSGDGSPATAYGHYGNVIAVFKPEVKDRTTFTMKDSLIASTEKGAKYAGGRTLRYRSEEPLPETTRLYIEAQVWGKLTMNDVSHFIVDCDENDARISKGALQALRALGKKVYRCSPVKVGERVVRFEAGEIIP